MPFTKIADPAKAAMLTEDPPCRWAQKDGGLVAWAPKRRGTLSLVRRRMKGNAHGYQRQAGASLGVALMLTALVTRLAAAIAESPSQPTQCKKWERSLPVAAMRGTYKKKPTIPGQGWWAVLAC